MKKTVIAVFGVVVFCFVLIALLGIYKFSYLASKPGYDVDGNKIEAIHTYEVAAVLEQRCQTDMECEIPAEYAIRSNCPYSSICLENQCTVICPQPLTSTGVLGKDPKYATYIIDGASVTLVDGVFEVESAPGSVSTLITKYFGNEVSVDLNNDGREDEVFLLTQEGGGSGTFFYVVAALNTEAGWLGSKGYFLGDRIAPQTTNISDNPSHENVIVVNYADREAGQAMSVVPSVGKSVWLKFGVDSMMFGEVEQNFPGEADPAVMSLDMQTWTWIQTVYNNDTKLVPAQSKAFTLTFSTDGSVSVTTDCNAMSGTYELNKNQITFGAMAMTRMFCTESQEQEFAAMLSEIQSYFFTPKGELIFELKYDAGSATFR